MQNGDTYITGIGGFDGANSHKAKSVQAAFKDMSDTIIAMSKAMKEMQAIIEKLS